MQAVASWWLALTLLGLAAWPLLVALRVGAPAKGYALARIVGLLSLALVFWWLNLLGVAANDGRSLWSVAAVLGLASVALWVRQWPTLRETLRRDWRHILLAELLFASAFFLYAAYKAHDPAINHTEEPMDFAFLNALLRSPRLPPRDPWLAGHNVSYYYLGYLLVAVVARLTGTLAGVAYNLGLAQTLALAVVGGYGVMESLRRSRDAAGKRWGWGGALGGLAIVLVGNLEGLFEGLRALGVGGDGWYRWLGVPGLASAPATGSWLPEGHWWWWRASRPFTDANFLGKLPTVIAEFPAFSLLLGDLHPHVMALPLVTLALLLAVELYRLGRGGSTLLLDRQARLLCLLAPLLLGALGFANSWDLPTFLGVALAALWLGRSRAARDKGVTLGAVLFSGYLLVASILFYLPFYWTLSSQAQGIGLAYYTKTPLRSYLLCFGVWLVPVLAEAVRIWREQRSLLARRKRLGWLWLGVLVLPWLATWALGGWGRTLLGLGVAALRGPWLTLALSGLIAVYALGLVGQGDPPPRRDRLLARLLIMAALCLTYVVEFIYLRDLFATRMNTVFKVYYQAWVLFGVGALTLLGRSTSPKSLPSDAASNLAPDDMRLPSMVSDAAEPGLQMSACGRWTESSRRLPAEDGRGESVPRVVAVTLLCLSLYYLVATAYTRARANPAPLTLDGTAYLAELEPDAYGAYQWLLANALPNDVLAEAPGAEYDAGTSRLSAWTGVPTVLGWPGHETQWRGDEREISARLPDLQTIYTSSDEEQVRALLGKYGVTLVYVGTYEQERYGIDAAHLAWYGTFLQPVYAQGAEHLYRVS